VPNTNVTIMGADGKRGNPDDFPVLGFLNTDFYEKKETRQNLIIKFQRIF
jgi:hypothetical protein